MWAWRGIRRRRTVELRQSRGREAGHEDRQVATFDGKRWQFANDPQPGASGSGGSFLPPFGDAMAQRFDVPVGFIACGIGATSVREWLPKGTKFPNPPTLTGRVRQLPSGEWESKGEAFDMLVARMKQMGPHGFRAVLWHQGESDANQQDPTRTLPGNLYREYSEASSSSRGMRSAGTRRGSWPRSAIMCRVMKPRPTSARRRLRCGRTASPLQVPIATPSRVTSARMAARVSTSAARPARTRRALGGEGRAAGWNSSRPCSRQDKRHLLKPATRRSSTAEAVIQAAAAITTSSRSNRIERLRPSPFAAARSRGRPEVSRAPGRECMLAEPGRFAPRQHRKDVPLSKRPA